MIILSLVNRPVAFYRYLLILNTYEPCLIIELVRSKVSFSVINDFIRGIKIYINLYMVKYFLYILYR